jgi:hypothetical protein
MASVGQHGEASAAMHDYLLHPFVDHASPYAYAVG